MKKSNFKLNLTTGSKVLLLMMFFMAVPVLAQTGDGAGAIGRAVAELTQYKNQVKLLIYAIGGIVGLIGGLRIYSKWTNGDQDINKELMGWGGACLFLFLVPQFLDAFFPAK